MSLYGVAFITGLFGSLHCVGMCGPLALSIHTETKGLLMQLLFKGLYNLGRLLAYASLGLLLGLFGQVLPFSGIQRYLSILSGVTIFLIVTPRLFRLKWGWIQRVNQSLSKPIMVVISTTIQHKWGHFLLGLFNGFLPCGFVYMALAGSLATQSVVESILFMICFGLGTVPLMLSLAISPQFLSPIWRNRLFRYSSYFAVLLAVLFILRGLNLGIPYLSPTVEDSAICH